MHKSKSGFTIVELLIVIVVIGILAALVITAYGTIQARAHNAQQLTVAQTYIKAFSAYVAANGSYPTTPHTRVCLGIDPTQCTTAPTAWHRDATLETALKTITTPLPTASEAVPLVSSPKMAYIPVSDVTLDGTPVPFVVYSLKAPGTCTTGTPASGTWPSFSSTPPTTGYTWGEAGLRMCFIPLPLPR